MPVTAAECDPNYTGACVPANAPDVSCDEIKKAVKVVGTDIHGLDADQDGTGCDEYANGSSGTATTKTASGQKSCSAVFVGGKGIVDSCSSEHKDTTRVYPRKPGVPANGCAETCPEPDGAAAPAGTPTPEKPSGTPSNATPTPIDTEYTPPMDLGQTPTAPQTCDRVSYPDICVPPAPPYLSCSDIQDRNFRVRAPDPHRFDADGNGIGCEEVRGPSIGR
jgi:hypothetical protein